MRHIVIINLNKAAIMKKQDCSSISAFIVESDSGYRNTLKIIRRNIGIITAYEVTDTLQAFRLLKKYKFDVILSEFQLPEFNGFQPV